MYYSSSIINYYLFSIRQLGKNKKRRIDYNNFHIFSIVMTVYAIITFHNTHFALKAKKVLEKRGRKPETIPVPREFSSECGFCCKVLWEEKDTISDILAENSVEFDAVHRWERDEDMERKKKFRFV
jgi:hypothetical protein